MAIYMGQYIHKTHDNHNSNTYNGHTKNKEES